MSSGDLQVTIQRPTTVSFPESAIPSRLPFNRLAAASSNRLRTCSSRSSRLASNSL